MALIAIAQAAALPTRRPNRQLPLNHPHRLQPTSTPVQAPTATSTVTATPTSPSSGSSACQVAYRIDSDWSNGMVLNIVLTNQGTSKWNGWQATWNFGGNQQIANLWNGIVTQSGQQVSLQNAGWNGQVAPGGTAGFGFTANYSGSNGVPTNFAVNGQSCTPAMLAQGASTTTAVALAAPGSETTLTLVASKSIRQCTGPGWPLPSPAAVAVNGVVWVIELLAVLISEAEVAAAVSGCTGAQAVSISAKIASTTSEIGVGWWFMNHSFV